MPPPFRRLLRGTLFNFFGFMGSYYRGPSSGPINTAPTTALLGVLAGLALKSETSHRGPQVESARPQLVYMPSCSPATCALDLQVLSGWGFLPTGQVVLASFLLTLALWIVPSAYSLAGGPGHEDRDNPFAALQGSYHTSCLGYPTLWL